MDLSRLDEVQGRPIGLVKRHFRKKAPIKTKLHFLKVAAMVAGSDKETLTKAYYRLRGNDAESDQKLSLLKKEFIDSRAGDTPSWSCVREFRWKFVDDFCRRGGFFIDIIDINGNVNKVIDPRVDEHFLLSRYAKLDIVIDRISGFIDRREYASAQLLYNQFKKSNMYLGCEILKNKATEEMTRDFASLKFN